MYIQKQTKNVLCIFEDILQVSDVLLTNPKLSNTDFSPLLIIHEKKYVYMQGSRVQPNFSIVQLKQIWAVQISCSREKKVCDSESLPVVQQQTHIRPISWSKPIRDSEGQTPLSDWPWSRYSCTCV